MLWLGTCYRALLCLLSLLCLAAAHACLLQEQLAAATVHNGVLSILMDNCTLGPSHLTWQGSQLLLRGNGSFLHDLDLALQSQGISVPNGSLAIANATVVGAQFTESFLVMASLKASSMQLMGLQIQTDCRSLLAQSQLAIEASAQVVLGWGFLYVSNYSSPGVSLVDVNVSCPITSVYSPGQDHLVATDWWTLYNALSLVNFPTSSVPGAGMPAAVNSTSTANSTAGANTGLSALYGSIPTVIYLAQHISLTNWLASILLTRNTSLVGAVDNRPMLDLANRKRVLLVYKNVTEGRLSMQNINIMNSVQLTGEYLPQARQLPMMVYPLWSIWYEPWNFYRAQRPIMSVNVSHVYPKQEYSFFEGVTYLIESPVTGSLTQSQLVYKAFFSSIKYDLASSNETTLAYIRFDTSGILMANFSILKAVPPGVPFPHLLADIPGPLFQPNVNNSAILLDTVIVYDAEQLLSAMQSLVTATSWDNSIVMYIAGNISMAGVKARWPATGFQMQGNITLTGLRPSEYPQFPFTVLDLASIPHFVVAKGGYSTLTLSHLTLLNMPTEAAAGNVWEPASSANDTVSLPMIDTQGRPTQLSTITLVIPLEEYDRVVNQVKSSIQGGSLGNFSIAGAADGSLQLVYIQIISNRAWRGSALTMTWMPPVGFNVTYNNVMSPPPPGTQREVAVASGGDKLSAGAIAGIIVGSVAGGLLIVTGIAAIVIHKLKQELRSSASQQEAYQSSSQKNSVEVTNGSKEHNMSVNTPSKAGKRRNELLAGVQDMSVSGAGHGGDPGSNNSAVDYSRGNTATPPTPADDLHQVMQSVLSDIDDKHLEVLDVIGQGGFGTVYKGSWKGLTVAIKTITFQDRVVGGSEKAQQTAIMEAAISTLLVHPNVVATYSYDLKPLKVEHPADDGGLRITNQVVTDWKLYIVQEFCDAGSLRMAVLKRHFWNEAQRQPRMDHILDAALELASGLQHLHSKNIIHGDLNPNNVLLKREAASKRGVVCKLCDFGLSIKMSADQSHISNMRRGTPFYTAPEVMNHGNMTKAADCYSFGVMLWELYHNQTCYRTAANGFHQREHFPLFPRRCPVAYSSLAAACMAPEAAQRPPFSDITQTLEGMYSGLLKGQLVAGDGLPVVL